MHFLYASDEGFSDVLKASLHSLLLQHQHRDIAIHVVGDGLSETAVQSITAMVNGFDQSIDFTTIPDFRTLLGRDIDAKRFTLSAFSRLFVDSLVDVSLERIIYLDCDTIIKSDLFELWLFDLKGSVIGAVNDCRSWRYLENLGLGRRDVYVNSGVLLIDLVKFREGGWQGRFRQAMVAYDRVLEFPDNDLICMLMQDHMTLLPPRFNVISPVRLCSYDELHRLRRPTVYYSREEFDEAKRRPAILHYTTFFAFPGRPWHAAYDHRDGAAFMPHFEVAHGTLRAPFEASIGRRAAHRLIRSPLRGPALRFFGLAHGIIKPARAAAVGDPAQVIRESQDA